jgi:hypothetical protein
MASLGVEQCATFRPEFRELWLQNSDCFCYPTVNSTWLTLLTNFTEHSLTLEADSCQARHATRLSCNTMLHQLAQETDPNPGHFNPIPSHGLPLGLILTLFCHLRIAFTSCPSPTRFLTHIFAMRATSTFPARMSSCYPVLFSDSKRACEISSAKSEG